MAHKPSTELLESLDFTPDHGSSFQFSRTGFTNQGKFYQQTVDIGGSWNTKIRLHIGSPSFTNVFWGSIESDEDFIKVLNMVGWDKEYRPI